MASTSSSRDSGDFVQLWTASSRRIYAFIFSLLPRWADADEILQETSRTLWEKFDEFQPGTDFTKWACRVAYLKVLEARHQHRRAPLPFSDAFIGAVQGELAEKTETVGLRYAAMLDCLQKLGERDRELIRRRYYAGSTAEGMARDLNRSVPWVYKTLQRIHQALFDCIERARREGNL